MQSKAEAKVFTGYFPRKHQEDLHKNLKRFNVIVAHRRFGKSVFSVNEMIDQGIRCAKRNPQYAYIAPNYQQAKRVIWQVLKDYTSSIPGVQYNEAELRVDIPRPWLGDNVRFMLLGAENPDSLRGLYLDGAILDEYASMHPDVWGKVIRPALADRMGWAIFISTPAGMNSFYELYMHAKDDPAWFADIFKASQTNILPKDELEAARREMTEEEFAQEFECSFSAALKGAYYSKEMAEIERTERVGHVPHQKEALVHTSWDIGVDDTTAIWFIQEIGKEFHVIDFVEASGMGLDYYVAELNKKPYIYGNHYFPHDIRVRELGTGGDSREQTLRDLGRKNIRVGIKHTQQVFMDSVQRVRMLLAKCWFDKGTRKGVEALKNYERKYDAKLQAYQNRPKHNWASHAADAFREFTDQHREEAKRPDIRSLPRRSQSTYDIFNRGR